MLVMVVVSGVSIVVRGADGNVMVVSNGEGGRRCW